MKENNEMSPHFRKTVAEIDGDIEQLGRDIERLRGVRETIVDLYGGESEIGDEPSPPRKEKKGGGRKAAGAASKRVEGGAPAEVLALIAAVQALPEPVTAEGVQAAGRLPTTKDGSNRITKWLKLGWLTRVSRGCYNRTASFGTE